jgi:hypothetical protein
MQTRSTPIPGQKFVTIAASVNEELLTHIHQTVLSSAQVRFERPESGRTVAECNGDIAIIDINNFCIELK